MIELRCHEQLERAIAKAKAEARNLVVRITNAIRMYRVENRKNANVYFVNFCVRKGGKRFAHCSCEAGEQRIVCKHVAGAASLNMYQVANGQLSHKLRTVA